MNSFLCDVEMVGLSGFLYNVSPASDRSWSDLRETAEALETVGHAGCAAILRDLATRLERLPFDAAATWGALLDPLAEHLEADVSPVVESHIEDLYSRLEAFTKQHFGGGTGS